MNSLKFFENFFVHVTFSYQNGRLYAINHVQQFELHSLFSFRFSLGASPAVHPHNVTKTHRSDCNYWYMGACHRHAPVDIPV